MDIHEIQRLHAQFAPDSMVIDLPRQLAALPAPGDFPADATPTARERWVQAGPIARRGVIAVAIAALVAMAGMGAASIYKAHVGARVADHASGATAVAAPAVLTNSQKPANRIEQPTSTREVDATPAQPVAGAPALSAADFASASSLGLTAEQFRASMRTPTASDAPKTSQPLSSESQLAAASPIRRTPTNRSEAPQAAPAQISAAQTATPMAPQAVAKAAPATVAPAQPSAAPAQPAPVAQMQSGPSASAAEESGKPAHPVRRHISRPRTETATDSDSAATPAPSNRAGSAEVKMF